MTNIQDILAGDRLSLSRILSQIENDTSEGRSALGELFPHTGQAHLIGITGAPGTGKSTLVNQIAYHYRHSEGEGEPKKVAIVAVDPTSPFTGGAVLGDRIRMQSLSSDKGVFIRSMATRGSLGGLANATAGIVQAFDAAGFEIILIETVGAGQAEIDIAHLAHTTIVTEAPGLGDDIQAIKAGILEIADILVVNKADRSGVESTERALLNMLKLAHPVKRIFSHHSRPATNSPQPSENDSPIWIPPVLRTVATEGAGVPELLDAIAKHRAYLQETGELELRERARLEAELDNRLQNTLVDRWRDTLKSGQYEKMLDELVARQITPYQAVQTLLNGGKLK
ncbi:MAG: methylmalonyl Co-A mutase-associated GTPase MeaB [Chloroflexi bacterium]|nr:methylmalonyl Co-A mutase-associated GTPase MeaB [Chloroflexota bacterium]